MTADRTYAVMALDRIRDQIKDQEEELENSRNVYRYLEQQLADLDRKIANAKCGGHNEAVVKPQTERE